MLGSSDDNVLSVTGLDILPLSRHLHFIFFLSLEHFFSLSKCFKAACSLTTRHLLYDLYYLDFYMSLLVSVLAISRNLCVALFWAAQLPQKLLERLLFYCLSALHCPWLSHKHMENGTLLQKIWLMSWRIRHRGYKGTHNNNQFERGLPWFLKLNREEEHCSTKWKGEVKIESQGEVRT